jgi:fructosamine-3-kinase
MIDRALSAHAARLLGSELVGARPLGGGDLNVVVEVELADGRRAVVKGGPAPRTEASMLAAIAAAGAPAPAVLAVDDSVLVLEPLASGGRVGDAWSELGAVLAALHGGSGCRYGWPDTYAFGGVEIENAWSDDWPRFWAERRLVSQLAYLPPELARRIERLAADLPARLPGAPRPALLHGDLWGGNVLVAAGRVSGLIDPACYYGDGEVDLAMLALFDRPDRTLFDAYGPLEPGREERLPIYQLWPALVHLRLFGAGYAPMVERMLASAGA